MGDTISKRYLCPVCKINHDINLAKDLVKGKDSFPITHIIIHKFLTAKEINEKDIDILTTLYIDANMNIRGVEAVKLISSDLISKENSAEMVQKLMNHIVNLQQSLDDLQKKYDDLLVKSKK